VLVVAVDGGKCERRCQANRLHEKFHDSREKRAVGQFGAPSEQWTKRLHTRGEGSSSAKEGRRGKRSETPQ
jgi:hypothetical protein